MASKIIIEPVAKVEIYGGLTYFNPKSRSHQPIGFHIACDEKGVASLLYDGDISPRERRKMDAAVRAETSRMKLIKRLEHKLAAKKIAANIALYETK